MPDKAEITRLLRAVEAGSEGAVDRLMEAVYVDLERIARAQLDHRFGPGHPGVTLEPAALVHESYLKLLKQRKGFDDGGHFRAVASRVMLRVLLDHERKRRAEKRGGDRRRITLQLDHPDPRAAEAPAAVEVERLASALEQLEELDARKAEVVKLRVLWGLTMPEAAEALDLSVATVERDWAFAKAWLVRAAADSGES